MFKPYIMKIAGKWTIINSKLCTSNPAYMEAKKFIDKLNTPKEGSLNSDDYTARIKGGERDPSNMNVFRCGVEITHKPSGTSAFCNKYRNQFKNKAEALRMVNERRSSSSVVR